MTRRLLVLLPLATALGAAPAHATLPARNGAALLVIRADGLWRVPADPGPGALRARRIAGGRVTQAGWSADGRRIAFVRVRGDRAALWTAAADGSRARRRTAAGRGVVRGRLSWSPHATRIAFADARGVVSWPLGPGARHRVGPPGGRWPSFSPTARRLVLAAGGTVRITALGGAGTRDLLDEVTGAPRRAAAPDYAPGGGGVLFAADHALYRFTFAGRAVARVSPTALPDPREPAWSPDGRRIAFVVRSGGARDGLYVAHPDGTEPVRVLSGSGLRDPAWQPR